MPSVKFGILAEPKSSGELDVIVRVGICRDVLLSDVTSFCKSFNILIFYLSWWREHTSVDT